jgi:hypothetical protein
MRVREIQRGEWARFFDAFSRTHLGRPVTISLWDEGPDAATLGRGMPLIGIAVEPCVNPESIEVIAGEAPREMVSHVIHAPSRVRIAQVSNGEDEMFLIASHADGSITVVDFRPARTDPKPLLKADVLAGLVAEHEAFETSVG